MMDSMCASGGGVNLLPGRSRLCQTNTATNKVNLMPSHYPPPGILIAEAGTCGPEFVMLSSKQSHPVNPDMTDDSLPPPLPPREPTGCSGVASSHRAAPVPLSSHRAAPVPICLGTADRGHEQMLVHFLDGTDRVRIPERHNGLGTMNINSSGGDCSGSSVHHGQEEARQLVLLNPVVHHHHDMKHADTDDITHHCWNVLQVHAMTSGLITNKELSGCVTSHHVTDDGSSSRPSDASSGAKTPSSGVQPAVLNQVIPLSRWPIGSRQPETHFVLDRVVVRAPAGNEYVDSPLHVTTSLREDLQISGRCKRTNTASVRLENSLQDCSTQVVTTQPTLSGNGKPKDTDDQNAGKSDKEALSPRHPPCKEGLICSRCGKCRCMSCTQPRQMPRCWVGPSFYRCECSAQQVVSICSCLCCVQALFYHCLYHPDDEHDIVMEPCACCESSRCCLRWTILGLLVPCLPCLCLYCPLQCGVDACTSCYNSCSQRGCHCGYNVSSSGSSTTRDLLLDSEPSST